MLSKSFFNLVILTFLSGQLIGQSAFDQYLGSNTPQLFADGIISINGVQWNNAIDAQGNIYLTKQLATRSELVFHEFNGSQYLPKKVIPLDTNAIHSDIWVNSNGDHMMFMSTLKSDNNDGFNLWESKRTNGEWSKPTEIHKSTSGDGGEAYPWLTDSGNLYFSVARDNSRNSDVYVLKNGENEAQKLPAEINSDAFEGDAFVSSDESFMIFAAFDRPEGLGLSELFISFKTDGGWTTAKWMGSEINSEGYDGSPVISPDGRFLLFTSSRASVGQEAIFFNHYIVEFDPNDYR